jgi:hypothetical protein
MTTAIDNRQPGDAEFAGALAQHMENFGPTACYLPAVGDRVTYRTRAMTECGSESGRVVRITVDTNPVLIVQPEGEEGLRVIDPRPWPTGNLLPF